MCRMIDAVVKIVIETVFLDDLNQNLIEWVISYP